jgi:hypothetical protein
VAFQVPITARVGGTLLEVTTKANVTRAHGEGYAWQNWFSDDDRDAPGTWRSLVDMCVDGIMTSHPVAAPEGPSREAPACGLSPLTAATAGEIARAVGHAWGDYLAS